MASKMAGSTRSPARTVLAALAAGQFVMILDSSVMNVSIAQVAQDVGTTITGIQTAITMYTLVMAMFMIPGGKIGSIIGRKRAFVIGCVIYGTGSLTTGLAPSLGVLLLGWSLLEGLGAALILPAIVALVAGNFEARERPRAYGLVMSAGAIAIAIGPLLGGLATTYATWRLVFFGEVLIIGVILLLARQIRDAREKSTERLDVVGAILAAAGLGLAVYGVLRSGVWGWVSPKPEAPSVLGISMTMVLVIVGGFVLWLFVLWERRRETGGRPPLIQLNMLGNRQLNGGLIMFFCQYLVQMGLFFTIPLYLSVALGLTAIQTGIRILPLSITLLAAAAGIPRLVPNASPRKVVRFGILSMLLGVVALFAAMDVGVGPEIVTVPLLLAGLGIGALSSQLGAVAVSAVPDDQAPDVGGLQNTASNLGSSLGTALAGSIMVAALTASFFTGLAASPKVSQQLTDQAEVQLSSGVPFVSDADVQAAVDKAKVPEPEATAIVETNTQARIDGLRAALAVLALIALAALFPASRIPERPVGAAPSSPSGPAEATPVASG